MDDPAVPMRRPAAARGRAWNSGEEKGHSREDDYDHRHVPFHHLDEKPVRVLVLGEIIAGLFRGFDPSVVGHRVLPICARNVWFA